MNTKYICKFVLLALLFSSCFKSKLMMDQVINEKVIDEDEKVIGNEDNKTEINLEEVYDGFFDLIDDKDVPIDEILEFLDQDNRIQCLLESGLPFVNYVVENGDDELLEAMLEKYKSYDLVNCRNGEWECTPLHMAAREGNMHMVKLLLEKGAKVDIVDKEGNTILHYACHNTNFNSVEIFKCIAEKNYDLINKVNKISSTVLHVATQVNNIKLVKYLVENYGYMINSVSEDLTACHLAVISGSNLLFELITKSPHFEPSSIEKDIDILVELAVKNNNSYMIKTLQDLKIT
jgi:hypothetical protein